MIISIEELRRIVHRALSQYGYSEGEIGIIREVLMYAQMRGNNQGVVKLISKGFTRPEASDEIKVVRETKLSALINGNNHSGMVVMDKAMRMALQKAKEHGFGIAGTNNTNTSTGAIGYYAKEIASKGFIGFVYAGSLESVSAHGSYQPIFGTNPLAIGVPSSDEPVVLDMATASMAWYGLVEASTAKKSIPEGFAYDKEGNFTKDPDKAMEGALVAYGGRAKGSGLSMMVEILTGALVGASFTGVGDTDKNWGNLIYVIDPELLADSEEFKKNVSIMREKVKATKKLPGVEEIFVPGERGDRLTQSRIKAGEIEIEDNLFEELKRVVGEEKI